MGSSAKKRKDKKKDFRDEGTANIISAIILNQQSITTAPPSAGAQFSHHVSLLKSRNDSQCRDSLSYLTTAITTRPANAPLPQPVSVLLPNVMELMLHKSNGVRAQLLKLLRSLPSGDVEDHVEHVLRCIRAGITKLVADIRSSSLDVLSWAVDSFGNALVSCPGGWVQTLKSLMAMQGWSWESTAGTWSSSDVSFGQTGTDTKILVKGLDTLTAFLRAGFDDPPTVAQQPGFGWPHTHTDQHMISKKSNAYAHLNLFGPPRDEDWQMYEDREERQRIFQKKVRQSLEGGASGAKQLGGEVGRAGAALHKIIVEGMKDFDG
ncbi:MAG: hypothetical protein Q9220_000043 [cf. Caloplaca sp. 1 TL-2023]